MRFWARPIVGVLVLLIGVVWIGQGVNLIEGSGMSGHGEYAIVGVIVALYGLWLLWAPVRMVLQKRRP